VKGRNTFSDETQTSNNSCKAVIIMDKL